MSWPGHVPAGKVDDESIVAGVDWLPTICTHAGAPLPQDFAHDGEDVGDIFLGAARPRSGPLFWEWRFNIAGEPFHKSPMLAVRDGNWKLLLNPDRSRVELYDLPNDPTQLNNVAEHHSDVVERLAAAVPAWQKELPPGQIDATAGKVS